MNQKQIEFLERLEKDLCNSPSEKILQGTKYKNGLDVLDAHLLSPDQWIELVSLGDRDGLWEMASDFLRSL